MTNYKDVKYDFSGANLKALKATIPVSYLLISGGGGGGGPSSVNTSHGGGGGAGGYIESSFHLTQGVTYTVTVVDNTANHDPVSNLNDISVDVVVDGFGAQEHALVWSPGGIYAWTFSPILWDITDVVSWTVFIGDENIGPVDPITIDPTPDLGATNNTATIEVEDTRP